MEIFNMSQVPHHLPKSSQITHIQSSNIHPLAHILDTCEFILNSSALFTLYPTLVQVITTKAWEGGPKQHRAKQNGQVKLIQLHLYQGSSLLSCIVVQPPPSFHCCPRPPSHKPCCLTSVSHRTRPPHTSAINTLQAIRYSSILFTCPNHLNTVH